jgi:hypothetical protein
MENSCPVETKYVYLVCACPDEATTILEAFDSEEKAEAFLKAEQDACIEAWRDKDVKMGQALADSVYIHCLELK